VHDYQRVDGVFAEQALVLSEQSGREFLNPSGLIPSDRKTWDLLKRKRSSSPLSDNEFQAHQRWVNRALVTQVETEYLSIESRLPQGRTATVRSGSSKNHGASLGDVAGVPNARELFPRPTPQPT